MTVALIVAAGRGERLGGDRPKALVEVGGRSLLGWSLEALRAAEGIDQIVVALPSDSVIQEWGVAGQSRPEVVYIVGGETRSESVRRALAAALDGEPVLVHDAARPLVTAELAQGVIAALLADPSADAAIAASPVTDTVKRVGRDGVVRETLDRGELWAVQTPQVFRRAALERALDVEPEVLAAATDDASLIELAGGRVIVVPASPENVKVTTPLDLELAEMLLARRRPPGA
ncbi:MAG TPA: 2-C-methyl-D-erythritol 4-phosphate cytidylyltransferase [Solirubrobacteraceae bacterium]|jgi:2-C-methyl-D-erythritol 4-phosphate cytidylyltransferase|nr:2-C-methyl-D-erythritol 4-phosphate cytidylyltransferase [Solirubrobacteraceae bacterium]